MSSSSKTPDGPSFCINLNYAPHEPLDPPKRFLERYKNVENAGYYASVANLDWNVGRLLDALRKHNILDRTFIILTTEHGRTWIDRPGTAQGMCIPYDESSRIPLILRYPPALPQGLVWNPGVSLVDLLPTILEIANVSLFSPELARMSGSSGPPVHGRSLVAEVRSRRDNWSRPVILQNISQAAIDGSNYEDRAIRTAKWKLILRKFDVFPNRRLDELYDMQADPGETKNVYNSPPHRGVVKELAAALRAWGEEHGDSLAVELARRSESS